MDRRIILDEIRRTANTSRNPLGWRRFESETGIKPYHWQKYWARFSDAQREAGCTPNEKNAAYELDIILAKVVELTRSLGRIPPTSDMRVAAASHVGFPDPKTILGRLGNKEGMIKNLYEYCNTKEGYDDVLATCKSVKPQPEAIDDVSITGKQLGDGFVYLLKCGRYYKLGGSNSVGRREREISLQLPERTRLIYEIRTGDPVGIEAYWHKRFESKRKNGEWFALDARDVSAFRRRKFM